MDLERRVTVQMVEGKTGYAGADDAAAAAQMLRERPRLNLGSGQNPFPGYINVDKYGEPDWRCDLEVFPWPWPDSSIEEVQLIHVLEHLGRDPDVFIGVMKELYRVCKPGARVRIRVPHPRHDDFIGDPTHVRVITPQVMSLFSRRNCETWKAQGAANSPLALYHGVDFETIEAQVMLVPAYQERMEKGQISAAQMQDMLRERNNVAFEIRLVLEVRK
ncbi:MAG TPA: hypothetical protein VMS45_02445 [Gemmatimonadaceae bacterium]|jgi:hypothetical protein|nr:hypothetical protein [Gemmatimonadaceae bacterium]